MLRLTSKKLTVIISLHLLLFVQPPAVFSQSQAHVIVDSLKKELAKAKEDTNKVHILKEIANNIGYYDLSGALNYSLEGLELSKKLDYPLGVGHMSYITGITYADLGDYTKADSFLTVAEEKYKELADSFRLYKVANARGSWSYMQGKYWLAADYYTKAAEGFDKVKDSTLALIAYQNLISVLGQINNHEKSF
jgi:two-component system, NarL family, sensor kinase